MKLGQGRAERAQRAKWSQVLSEITLPQPHTMEGVLREYVRTVRGNRLILSSDAALATPGGPSGMWIPSAGVDLIWVDPAATGVARNHILGHEMGHMVNGDSPSPVDLRTLMLLLQQACSHTSPDLWEASMCRSDDTSDRHSQEGAAEEFSYFVQGWLERTRPPMSRPNLMLANMWETLETRSDM